MIGPSSIPPIVAYRDLANTVSFSPASPGQRRALSGDPNFRSLQRGE